MVGLGLANPALFANSDSNLEKRCAGEGASCSFSYDCCGGGNSGDCSCYYCSNSATHGVCKCGSNTVSIYFVIDDLTRLFVAY